MDEVTVVKEREGWTAKTLIPLDLKRFDSMKRRDVPLFLLIQTSKAVRKGLYAHVTALAIDGDTTIWDLGGDFRKTVATYPHARATQSIVEHIQQEALEQKDALVAEAKAFYARKAVREAA